MLSMATGALVGVILAILGVDLAMVFGILAFVLNFIPNIGSLIAIVLPLPLVLVDPEFTLTLLVLAIALPGAVQMVIGNVIEPMWMGRKLGLSTVVVFLSLVVWGWIWGPVGMLLSVPLTMIIKILLEDSEDYHVVAMMLDTGEPEPPSTWRSPHSVHPPPSQPTESSEPDDVEDQGTPSQDAPDTLSER